MSQLSYLAISTSIAVLAGSTFFAKPAAANLVSVSCEQQASVPTVTATLSNHSVSQMTSVLSFLPQYFDSEKAVKLCQSTAKKLHTFYGENRMNYLASDTLNGQPVVCAVERRGLSCDSYNSDILFSLERSISPTELLYNMLGDNFKGSQPPSSRTVSRIYTDLKPLWWPF
ncbi:MAG: COP23 domain-containing protein [Cyanobacteria bacterium J06600_6]